MANCSNAAKGVALGGSTGAAVGAGGAEEHPRAPRCPEALRRAGRGRRGPTDSPGDHAGDMKLSKRRAEAVAEYATFHGLRSDRIRVEAQGETAPVAGNETQDGRQANRRVEIAIFANEKMTKMVEKQT